MSDVYGTPEYIELVTRYEPVTENARLKQLAINKSMDGMGRDAAKQLLKQNGGPLVWDVINGRADGSGSTDPDAALKILTALRRVGNKESIEILKNGCS